MGREGRDGSSSVMRELMAHAMDDGYTLATAREGGGAGGDDPKGRGAGGGDRRWSHASIAVLVALGLLLTVAAVQTRQSAPALAKEKKEIVEQIRDESERVQRKRDRSAQLEREVEFLQSAILARSESGNQLQEDVDRLRLYAGSSRVTGPGVRIELDDAEGSSLDEGDNGRVLDIDIQQIVNGLWAAGAEAISVNGERLTSMTPIRGADQAITVGYRPLSRPYVIEAIGNPDTLEARFAEGPGGDWVFSLHAKYHIPLDVRTVGELTLLSDTTPQLRYATTEGSE